MLVEIIFFFEKLTNNIFVTIIEIKTSTKCKFCYIFIEMEVQEKTSKTRKIGKQRKNELKII